MAVTRFWHVKKLIVSKLHMTAEIPKLLYQSKWCSYIWISEKCIYEDWEHGMFHNFGFCSTQPYKNSPLVITRIPLLVLSVIQRSCCGLAIWAQWLQKASLRWQSLCIYIYFCGLETQCSVHLLVITIAAGGLLLDIG